MHRQMDQAVKPSILTMVQTIRQPRNASISFISHVGRMRRNHSIVADYEGCQDASELGGNCYWART
jgi:hypothetical protein